MKKVLLVCSIFLLSIMGARGQSINDEGTGFRSDFDVAGEDEPQPCWIGLEAWIEDDEEMGQVYEAERTEDNTVVITGMGNNPEYAPVWYGFNHECGEEQQYIDISENPTIIINAKGAEGTQLQVHVADADGHATNCDNCMDNGVVTLSESFQEFEISVAEFLCQYGGDCEDEDGGIVVDATNIGNVNLTINPGSVNDDDVWVEIDYIVVGDYEVEEPELPNAPENFSVEVLSETEVELDWDDVEGADEYLVHWNELGEEVEELTIDADEERPYVVSDLEAGTQYSFMVATYADGQLSPFTDPIIVTTDGEVDHPDALDTPQNFEVNVHPNNTITVSLDAVENATGYALDYAPEGSDNWNELQQFNNVTWTSPVLTEDPYNFQGHYDFRVRALYDHAEDDVHIESEPSETVTVLIGDEVEPGTPVVPANFQADAISDTEIQLNWDAVELADNYLIAWQETDSGNWDTLTVAGDVNDYLVSDLSPETSYDFSIASVVEGEVSDFSGIVSAQTETTTSAARARMKVDLALYPNPSGGTTRIDYDAVSGMDIQVRIATSMGEDVHSFAGGPTGASFDASILNAGIYLVYIMADGEVVGVERLVVE
ncbi:fibronectin type III domain-containing protein [Cytophagaceae bacterium ABcell3]|nr:fibronectin type III domain-containing protein [Cytophagaceae bacterium ABcell3]